MNIQHLFKRGAPILDCTNTIKGRAEVIQL